MDCVSRIDRAQPIARVDVDSVELHPEVEMLVGLAEPVPLVEVISLCDVELAQPRVGGFEPLAVIQGHRDRARDPAGEGNRRASRRAHGGTGYDRVVEPSVSRPALPSRQIEAACDGRVDGWDQPGFLSGDSR